MILRPVGIAPALRAFLKEDLQAIIAGTGPGPEGSRPTAGNCRLQVLGEEDAIGLTGVWHCWRPLACPPFDYLYINSIFEILLNTTGNGITRM